MGIHVFGDSHGNYLFARATAVSLHCVPGRTMHRVGRDGASDRVDRVGLTGDDVSIFAFGEIDVRCHLLRVAAATDRSLLAVADDLASRYVMALTAALGGLPRRPRICLMGVVPPIDPLVPNPVLPVHGTLAERLVAWFLLDQALRARALEAGFAFVAIPRTYLARDGSLKRRLSDGHAHIAKDCTAAVVRAVEVALDLDLSFRPLPARRGFLRDLTRRLAIANGDYAALWTLGEANIDA